MPTISPQELAVEIFQADQQMEREFQHFFNFPPDGANFGGEIDPIGTPQHFLDEQLWTPVTLSTGALFELDFWEHPAKELVLQTMWELAESIRNGERLDALTDAFGSSYTERHIPTYLSGRYNQNRDANGGRYVFSSTPKTAEGALSLAVTGVVGTGETQVTEIKKDQLRNIQVVGGVCLFDYMRGGLQEVEDKTGVVMQPALTVETAIEGLMDAGLINNDFGWSVLEWAATPPGEPFPPESRIRPDGTPHVQ